MNPDGTDTVHLLLVEASAVFPSPTLPGKAATALNLLYRPTSRLPVDIDVVSPITRDRESALQTRRLNGTWSPR